MENIEREDRYCYHRDNTLKDYSVKCLPHSPTQLIIIKTLQETSYVQEMINMTIYWVIFYALGIKKYATLKLQKSEMRFII